MHDLTLRPGDSVRLRADPLRTGVVVDGPHPYAGGHTFTVFFGAKDQQVVAARALERVDLGAEVAVASRNAFLTALLVTKLSNSLGDVLYSYMASRTQFEPYQFKPVFKYLDAPVPGILIADEVGLGKTIEAAILYQELKARMPINRVLIVCPAGLREKWRLELLSRFDEDFRIFRSPDVTRDLLSYRATDGAAPVHAIVGLETIRLTAIQDALDENPVRFDLVIIDEAHHLRNTGTLSNRIAERLADMSDHLILLTATPLQTGQEDLFNLVRLLDETQFPSLTDFLEQLEPNARLNEAIGALRTNPPGAKHALRALREIPDLRAGGQVVAHPSYMTVVDSLGKDDLDPRRTAQLQREIDRMNVLSSIYTRTRKRDVTGIAQREAHVVRVPITDAEAQFYGLVLEHARAQARARSTTGWIPGFAGMMRERQAASCITATREYLVESLRGGGALLAEDSNAELDLAQADSGDARPVPVTDRLLQAARAVGTTDSKFDVFLQALRGAIEASPASKVIVFSYFRRTLSYLERRLKEAGLSVVQINGDVAPADRALLIDRFKSDPAVQVLLTSEVGSEGLDFQFCDTLFNYDLPWNPMRVEQRIGRIDRYGQRAEKIRIYSFFLAGTIEERILERLYERIGIFTQSVGDLEPILGPLANELTKDIFMAELTPAQESAKLDQMLLSLEVRRIEEEDLERRTAELLGQDSLVLQAVQDAVSSGRYVSAPELRAAVETFLAEVDPMSELEDRAGDGTVLLRPTGRLANIVADHVGKAADFRPGTTEFLQRVQSGDRIPGTFDGALASSNRRLELFNLRHPLVRAAVTFARERQLPYVPVADLGLKRRAPLAPDVPDGTYRFTIALFDIRSALPQTRLETLVFDKEGRRVPDLERNLLHLIQHLGEERADSRWTLAERNELETMARRSCAVIADQLEAEELGRNDATIAVRSATLRRTYGGRIAKRQAQIAAASDIRVQRMWSSEMRRAEEELAMKLAVLEVTRQVAITFSPVGHGRLTLMSEQASPPSREDHQDQNELPELPGATDIGGYPEPPMEDRRWR